MDSDDRQFMMRVIIRTILDILINSLQSPESILLRHRQVRPLLIINPIEENNELKTIFLSPQPLNAISCKYVPTATINTPKGIARSVLIMMNVMAESENDDRYPRDRHRILDKSRTGLRPYLSPKYPPIILPMISPINIDYALSILSDLVILKSLSIICTIMGTIVVYIPAMQDENRADKLFIKEYLPYFILFSIMYS